MNVAAVLFDWRGTLAHAPPPRWWAERGLETAGRALDSHELCRIEALYALDPDPVNHPLYPDAAPVLRELKARGARIAVVSDFHVDLRPMLAAGGVADLCDACIVSAEHGVQKPDPRIFEIALAALTADATGTLMVGDRASHDGGASGAGITTLILPPPPAALLPRGLDVVLRLVGERRRQDSGRRSTRLPPERPVTHHTSRPFVRERPCGTSVPR